MKRFFKSFLCWLLISNCFSMTAYAGPAWPADAAIEAEAGIVIDADSGAVLWGKDIDTPYPPASITKLLTALIVLEHSSLDETVTFSEDAINNVEADGGNKLNVAVGDQLSVEDCLYSLLVHSCNQVANALAEHVAETQEAFAGMMNEKIAALGCTNSHFDNASGLNGDTQYVTARDMAIISRAVFANPKIVEISAAVSHTFPATINNPDGITIYAENKLLCIKDSPYYYPAAKGGKIGYLLKAGNTLSTYAEQDGKRLISVILKGSPGQYYVDGKTLLEFGFANFENFGVAAHENSYTTGDASVEVGGTGYPASDLEIDGDGAITLPTGAAFSETEHNLVTEFPKEHPERSVAFIQYTYEGRKVGGAYLKTKEVKETETTAEPESQSEPKSEGNADPAAKEKKGSFLGPILLIVLVAAAAAGAGIAYLNYSKKKEERARALRREQRRRRLREEGVTEEEFDRLLQQRLETKGKKKK